MTARVLVIVPTYDERESLPLILERLHRAVPTAHVLVVDDASPDGTGEWAQAWADSDERGHVLHREGKQGLGPAYLAGFAWGLARDYDLLVEMDADGSHRPEQLPELLAAAGAGGAGGADLVLGSRWVPGGSVVDWPVHRRALSRGGNRYARWMLDLDVHDATGGFRVFRADHRRSEAS